MPAGFSANAFSGHRHIQQNTPSTAQITIHIITCFITGLFFYQQIQFVRQYRSRVFVSLVSKTVYQSIDKVTMEKTIIPII
jgi:hypothetical protein